WSLLGFITILLRDGGFWVLLQIYAQRSPSTRQTVLRQGKNMFARTTARPRSPYRPLHPSGRRRTPGHRWQPPHTRALATARAGEIVRRLSVAPPHAPPDAGSRRT